MTALVQVLTGRDDAPAWRSAASRRIACALGWLGWALIAAFALTLVLTGQAPHWRHGLGAWLWLALELAIGAAVAITPRRALLAWRLAYLGVLVTPLIGSQNRVDTGFYAILAIAFAVAGIRYGPPRLWWMAALTLIPVWLWTPPLFRGAEGGGFPLGLARPDWASPVRLTIGLAVLTALLYGAGRWRRDRLALAAQRQEARHQAAEARRQRERSLVLEERARIAREMHDVVAHHMSMIAVQAETAPYRIADLPDSAKAELTALGSSAREALADMRRLLGVLRSADGIERAPQPGLGDVPALVETARRAGAEVTLAMPERCGDITPVVGLAAYRIVQESLSNAGRHSPGAPIRVEVEETGGRVRVKVENGVAARGGRGGPAGAGRGQGLAGMRERAEALGGKLRAGRAADGGFAVRADLPAAAVLPAGGMPAGGRAGAAP